MAPRGLFQQISVGGHHTCALRREGTTICWGDDLFGSTSKVPKGTIFVQVRRRSNGGGGGLGE